MSALSNLFASSLTHLAPRLAVLRTGELFHSDDVASDSRITTQASRISHRSILCLPLFSNLGQILGALYLADRHLFTSHTVTMQTLLCKRAGISIGNALLVDVIQSTTKDNLKVIQMDEEALKFAIKSREEALRAMKVMRIY